MLGGTVSSGVLHKFSLIGIFYSLIVVAALHWLRPDYNPITRYVSEYAVGEFGLLAATAFSMYGLSILLASFFLQKSFRKIFLSKLPFVLLFLSFLSGIAIVGIGFFASDIKGYPLTQIGTVHLLLASIGLFAFVVDSFLISMKLKVEPLFDERKLAALRVLSLVSVGMFLLVSMGLLSDLAERYQYFVPHSLKMLSDLIGFTERIFLFASGLWLVLFILWVENND